MSKTRTALLLSTSSLYLHQFVSLAFTMYLARVFTPSELGAFGIAVAITMLSSEVRSLGSGEFLVREKTLSANMVRSSLGLTIIISWFFGFALIAGAGPIASFYDDQRLKSMIMLLSLAFFVAPYININASLLSRELQFGKMITIDWGALLTTYAVTVTCVYLEMGYMALIYGSVAGSAVQFLMGMTFKSEHMQLLPKFYQFSAQLRFGSIASLSSLAEKSNLYSIDLVVGKLGSMHQTAIVSKAVSAIELVAHMLVSGARPVVLPYLSKSHSSDLVENYKKATLLVTVICLPVLSAMIPVGDLMILILFGDQWLESADLIPYLALWGIFRNMHPFSRQLLISQNHEMRFLILQSITVAGTVSAVMIGMTFGLLGVAIALAVSSAIVFILNVWMISFVLNISVVRTMLCSLHSYVVTAVCLFFAYQINLGIRIVTDSIYLQLLAFGIGMAIVWFSTIYIFRHPITLEIKSFLQKSKHVETD